MEFKKQKIEKYYHQWVEFDSIEVGECFIDEEEEIAMKIESKFYADGGSYNAVSLETGNFFCITDGKTYKVSPIKCKLVVE